ncbi:MAG: aminopeptidase [Chloroflexota bacterium]
MSDPRLARLARLIVEYSTRIQRGDRVALEAEPVAAPFVLALYHSVLQAGGHPQVLITLPGQEDLLLRFGSDEQIDLPPLLRRYAYENFESRVYIHSLSNTKELANTDPARFARWRKAVGKVLQTQLDRGARGEFRWLTTLYPTAGYAQDAEMGLEEFEDFVFRACHVDEATPDPIAYWQGANAEQQRAIEVLEGHDIVEVRGPSCDLSLSLKGRTFLNACGEHNMPDGEIFTGPVETSVNGWVRFTYPAVYEGREATGVELRFVDGRVSQARAERGEAFLQEMLRVDDGARYLGEFAVGMNYGIQHFCRNTLFDEKIGGTFHVALGRGYPETGNHNQSGIHWDMICSLREGEIVADGEVVYRHGGFVT